MRDIPSVRNTGIQIRGRTGNGEENRQPNTLFILSTRASFSGGSSSGSGWGYVRHREHRLLDLKCNVVVIFVNAYAHAHGYSGNASGLIRGFYYQIYFHTRYLLLSVSLCRNAQKFLLLIAKKGRFDARFAVEEK